MTTTMTTKKMTTTNNRHANSWGYGPSAIFKLEQKMLKRLILIGLLAASPLPALAQSVQDQIISQLTDQGFGNFEISRTLLGRVRILSKSNTLSREMVFNPVTGEILRDYWYRISGGDVTPQIMDPNDYDQLERGANSGQGTTSVRSDDRNDDSSDDREDDKSDDSDDDMEDDKSDDREDDKNDDKDDDSDDDDDDDRNDD